MHESNETAPPEPRLSAVLQRSSQRRQERRVIYALLLLIAVALTLLVVGCATPPQPCEPEIRMPPPVIVKSPPSESYLTSALRDTQRWLDMLKTGSSKP